MENRWENNGNSQRLCFLELQLTSDDDCSHKIKRHLLLGRNIMNKLVQFSSVAQSCLTATPWTAAHQASLSITNSRNLLKLMSIELVMPSNHVILCRPLLLPTSIFPSIRVFYSESNFRIKWPKY